MIAVDFPPDRGPNGNTEGEQFPSVKNMTGGKEYPLGCVFSKAEIQYLENFVMEMARNLKAELYAKGPGSSIKEIKKD